MYLQSDVYQFSLGYNFPYQLVSVCVCVYVFFFHLWDLSSQTRDRTPVLSSESVES